MIAIESANPILLISPSRFRLTGAKITGCMNISFKISSSPHHINSYDMKAVEESMINQKISDPTDLTFLRRHLRELPAEVRKYLTWAIFFGET